MPDAHAYFLVTHGSPDPRPQRICDRLAADLMDRLVNGGVAAPSVGTGVLECSPISLADQLRAFARTAAASGNSRVIVLSLFLQAGVHAREDVPEAVAAAAAQSPIPLDLHPFLGSDPRFQQAIANWAMAIRRRLGQGRTPVVLLGHGSRRPGGNDPVEAMARRIGATAAYWSVKPGLADLAETIAATSNRAIVLPYFLFPGSLTDAISREVNAWNRTSPVPRWILSDPIACNTHLGNAIADILYNSPHPSLQASPEAPPQAATPSLSGSRTYS